MKPLSKHEERQRGTPDFPLEYHDLDEYHPRYQMPYHWHEEVEILRVKTGSFELTMDDEVFLLQPGDTALIASGSLHGGVPVSCTYECVVFDPQVLMQCSSRCRQPFSALLFHSLSSLRCFRADHPAVQQSIAQLFHALQTQCAGWELITLGCLFTFLGACLQNASLQPPCRSAARDDKRIGQLKKVFELIENDYSQPLTLEQLAGAVHMSPKYFCRFFRQATHRTPIDYLNYYRVESACFAFASTDKNITEVALDCGFSNSSYFIRLFRKYKGITPGQYLSALRQKE